MSNLIKFQGIPHNFIAQLDVVCDKNDSVEAQIQQVLITLLIASYMLSMRLFQLEENNPFKMALTAKCSTLAEKMDILATHAQQLAIQRSNNSSADSVGSLSPLLLGPDDYEVVNPETQLTMWDTLLTHDDIDVGAENDSFKTVCYARVSRLMQFYNDNITD